MKANPTAIKRLYRSLIKHHPIPTKEFSATPMVSRKRRVFLIPTKYIKKTEGRYIDYRDIKRGDAGLKNYDWIDDEDRKEYVGRAIKKVNYFRRVIRRKNAHLLPPIEVRYGKKSGHYELVDGHHRLTAHQAEGKRFIRSVIEDEG
jgi:hypothetical protein